MLLRVEELSSTTKELTLLKKNKFQVLEDAHPHTPPPTHTSLFLTMFDTGYLVNCNNSKWHPLKTMVIYTTAETLKGYDCPTT